jgi:hypothetical protein
MAITERESQQVDQANGSDRTPVVFIHGLWLLPSSWANWAQLFEEAGYAALTPDWPDDPETVEEASSATSTGDDPGLRRPRRDRVVMPGTARRARSGSGRRSVVIPRRGRSDSWPRRGRHVGRPQVVQDEHIDRERAARAFAGRQ